MPQSLSPELSFLKKLTIRQKTPVCALIGLTALGILVAAALAYAIGWTPFAAGPSASAATRTDELKLLPVIRLAQQSEFEQSVEYTGTVHSKQQTQVSFQRQGTIVDIRVDHGHEVQAGQLLAVLDQRQVAAEVASLTARMEQATAVLNELHRGPRAETIAAAKANVEDLTQQLNGQRLQLERSEKLIESKAVSRQDYEQVLYATRALEAKLNSAFSQLDELQAGTRPERIAAQTALVSSIEADLQKAKHDLADCRLTAPFDGQIVARHLDLGTVVAAGVPVLDLIDHRRLEVHAGLPSQLAAGLSIDDQFSVIVDDATVQGTVRAILPIVDARTRTRKVILEIADVEGALPVSGQIVRVQTRTRVQERGFWIPFRAIASDQRGLWSCYTVETESAIPSLGEPSPGIGAKMGIPSIKSGDRMIGLVRKHSVEVLHQEQDRVFVRGTLKDGNWLVADGLHRLTPNERVMISESTQLTGSAAGETAAVVPGSSISAHGNPGK